MCAFLNKIFLPANLYQHALHLIGDLVVASLFVTCSVAVHLVHTNADLLHTEQVDQTRVLACLTLDLPSLVVPLGNGCGEVAIRGHHDEGHICLGCASDHILDEITVTRSIYDCIMPLFCVELLCGTRNRHTALTLFLLAIHEESKSERALTKALCLLL